MEYTVSQPVVVPFTSVALATGLTTFADLKVIKDGAVVALAATFVELGGGVYTVTVTPTSTGSYSLFIAGSIQLRFEVVARTIQASLKNLEDEALGSWTWNKTTGFLTLIRQDGTSLATFNMLDSLEAGSRERVA